MTNGRRASSRAAAGMPSVDTELNDIPGTLPLGRYIESVAVGVGIEVVPPSTDESDSGKAADAYSTG